jgi:TrmH family RNA methyltransferase
MRPHKRVQRGFKTHPDFAQALNNIFVVMVGITHPGNIGAAARVMKNMSLRNLVLVSSTGCGPDTEAYSMASGAYHIIDRALRYDSLEEAVRDCSMVVGSSARIGAKRSHAKTPDELVPLLLEKAVSAKLALVFGRESKGLSNEEMKLCDHHLIIPSDEDFASLNVAQSIAIVLAGIFHEACRPVGFQSVKRTPARSKAKEEMYAHIQSVLIRAGFLPESNPLRMMREIRRIFNSADLDERDVVIIRGIFRKINNMIRVADRKILDLKERLNNKEQESKEI